MKNRACAREQDPILVAGLFNRTASFISTCLIQMDLDQTADRTYRMFVIVEAHQPGL